MERNIIEILVLLMKQYPQGAINPEEFEPLTNDLIGLGYSKHEIETALFWFYNRQELMRSQPTPETFSTGSFRVLHEVERAILTPEAYGYLLELKALGMITLAEMDSIIEKAIMLGGRRVDIDEMKSFVAAQVMEQSGGFPLTGHNFYLKTPSDRVQ